MGLCLLPPLLELLLLELLLLEQPHQEPQQMRLLRRLVLAQHPLLQSQRSWLCYDPFRHDVCAAFSPECLPSALPQQGQLNQKNAFNQSLSRNGITSQKEKLDTTQQKG